MIDYNISLIILFVFIIGRINHITSKYKKSIKRTNKVQNYFLKEDKVFLWETLLPCALTSTL